MAEAVRRGDVFLVNLDPTLGDEIRTVDHARLARRLGRLSSSALERALAVLQEMFTR